MMTGARLDSYDVDRLHQQISDISTRKFKSTAGLYIDSPSLQNVPDKFSGLENMSSGIIDY